MALERRDDAQRLMRIEDKIDKILEKVHKLEVDQVQLEQRLFKKILGILTALVGLLYTGGKLLFK